LSKAEVVVQTVQLRLVLQVAQVAVVLIHLVLVALQHLDKGMQVVLVLLVEETAVAEEARVQ
jgi:hypothetical protein